MYVYVCICMDAYVCVWINIYACLHLYINYIYIGNHMYIGNHVSFKPIHFSSDVNQKVIFEATFLKFHLDIYGG